MDDSDFHFASLSMLFDRSYDCQGRQHASLQNQSLEEQGSDLAGNPRAVQEHRSGSQRPPFLQSIHPHGSY